MFWPRIAFRRKRPATGSQSEGDVLASPAVEPTGPTLYDDWMARRRHLAGAPPGQHREMMISLLDYLIARYRDSPAALRPARFALKSGLLVNERAIVVLHHLKPIEGGRAKSPREAQQRMAAMVERITSHGQEDDLGESGDAAAGFVMAEPPELREVRRELALAVIEWRERLEHGEVEWAREALRPFLRRRELRPLVAERIRPELAHHDAAVRLWAITILGRIGELDDLGLLSDLLALPPQDDEHPQERATLIRAIERISRSGEDP